MDLIKLIKYIILGAIQGISEILPISSSAHLFIMQKILDMNSNNFLLEIFLHIGSFIAIIIFERKELVRLIKGLGNRKTNGNTLYECLCLVLSTIPIVIFVLLFEGYIKKASTSIVHIGLMLMINGLMIYTFQKKKLLKKRVKMIDALIIGLFQCAGSFSGISRSGSCLCGGFSRGIDKEEVSRYSFLLFVPVMTCVLVKSIFSYDYKVMFDFYSMISLLFAFISTFLSLKYLKKIISRNDIKIFAFYTFFLGLMLEIICFV